MTINKTRNDRRVTRTIRSIEQSLIHLLKSRHISKITVTELCNLADINRKTFYTYYESVDQVLAKINKDIIYELRSQIELLKSKLQLPHVKDLIELINQLLNENIQLINELLLIDELDELEHNIILVIKEAIIDMLNHSKVQDDHYRMFAVEYISNGVVGLYIQWFSDQENIPLSSIGDFIDGLLTSNIEFVEAYSSHRGDEWNARIDS